MSKPGYFDIGLADWHPNDVSVCGDCAALVLAQNEEAHATWHEAIGQVFVALGQDEECVGTAYIALREAARPQSRPVTLHADQPNGQTR